MTTYWLAFMEGTDCLGVSIIDLADEESTPDAKANATAAVAKAKALNCHAGGTVCVQYQIPPEILLPRNHVLSVDDLRGYAPMDWAR